MVFHLGMYTVATLRLVIVAELYFVLPLAGAFLWIAIAAWIAEAAGMLAFFAQQVRR